MPKMRLGFTGHFWPGLGRGTPTL